MLTPIELARILGLRPELRAMVLPIMQATEDATGKKITIPPNGGVRSNATQAALYAAAGTGTVSMHVAMPGLSRHEFGAGIDFNILGGTSDDYDALHNIATGMFGLVAVPGDRVHFQLDETLEASQWAWQALQRSRSVGWAIAIAAGALVVIMNSHERS